LPLPPITDGGYVFCSEGSGDGGERTWQCPPGTYFCDASSNFGCLQCRSDADCADESLPTFDRSRPRCDLHSGLSGHQNFCQQCLGDSDCEAFPRRPYCDIDSNYPLAPYSSTAIVNVGFETCGALPVDCRDDGGEVCSLTGLVCGSDSGLCVSRTGPCTSDADCGGAVTVVEFSAVVAPFCVSGTCNPCPGGDCPTGGGSCDNDSECNGPDPTGPRACIEEIGTCGCHSDEECAGPRPVCGVLDAGFVDSQGLPTGVCICETNAQCGDAGEVCAVALSGINDFVVPVSYCMLPCTAPGVPSCGVLGGQYAQICDSDAGFCTGCTSDEQCRANPTLGGPHCDGSQCTCDQDADCAGGQRCEYGDQGGGKECVAVLPGCTPLSCPVSGLFCDWDSGSCVEPLALPPAQPCLTDYDCTVGPDFEFPGQQSFCDTDLEQCEACLTDADCRRTGTGGRCVRDAGPAWCTCSSGDDCLEGQACVRVYCDRECSADAECAAGYFCAQGGACRPRCDGNHACQGSAIVCDRSDVAGQNGEGFGGDPTSTVWCYECLAASDCPSGFCSLTGHVCGICEADSDCPAGEQCTAGGCFPTCDAGACPAGSVCDTQGETWAGGNACVECLSPIDCPGGQGCNTRTGTCGTCLAPSAYDEYSNCPPGDICSTYWAFNSPGVCLEDCDLRSCPAERPICAVYPPLTPDHAYCFGCLSDSDCASLGAGAWCDTSVNVTFSCQPAP
jgi:hypothetical protein